MHIPYAVLATLPAVYLVGQAVPSVAMILPFSSRIDIDTKQILTALWQPWPAYVAFGLTASHLLLGSVLTAGDKATPAGRKTSAGALRYIYAMAFGNAAVSHLIAATITLGTVVAPALFAPKYAAALHPAKVLETVFPWATGFPVAKVASLEAGVHIFLRWDYNIGTTSLLLWSAILYSRAHTHYEGRCVDVIPFVSKIATLTALVGPAAAAVELMWEREEWVLQSEDKALVQKKKN